MLSASFAPFNKTPNANQLRQPRAIVMINNIRVLYLNIEVVTTTFYRADEFHVVIPLAGQPAQLTTAYLLTTVPMRVQIYIGFPADPNNFTPADLKLMITGNIDKLELDPCNRTATFSGRDLTSLFIDNKTYSKYSNQTSSTIVSNLAKQAGLTPVVTPTKTLAGTYYANQNTLLTKETTQWDLMCFLAQQEGFVIYVVGTELFFRELPAQSQTPFILQYQAPSSPGGSPIFNGMSLQINRSLTLAQNILVKIRVPFNPQTGKAFTVHANAQHPHSNGEGFQTYTFSYPGLTKAQALAKAQQIANDISLHEIILTAELPGDITLQKDSLIQLKGVDASVNQLYYTDNVVRKIDVNMGFYMTIQAKNHSPDSQVSI